MAPVTGSLILLILFYAGALADDPPLSEKAGRCPLLPMIRCIDPLPPNQCSRDGICPGNQKCCFNGCIDTCMDPVMDEKPGRCPSVIDFCPMQKGKCKVDKDCPGKKKCCIKYCSPECIDVV